MFSFENPRCYCHQAGLREKPRGDQCYHRTVNDEACQFDSEQAVLGLLLIDDGALDLVADILTAESFQWSCHRRLYQIITALIRRGERRIASDDCEPVVSMFGKQQGGVPLADYIENLFLNCCTRITVREYAENIVQGAVNLQLRRAA